MVVRNNHSSIAIIATIEIIQNCNLFYNRRAGCPVKGALVVAEKCVVNTNSIDCWWYTSCTSSMDPCAMSSVSWHFFMSSFMLSLRLIFCRHLLLLPQTSSHSHFAHTCVLASSSGQTTFGAFISDVVQSGPSSCPSKHHHKNPNNMDITLIVPCGLIVIATLY